MVTIPMLNDKITTPRYLAVTFVGINYINFEQLLWGDVHLNRLSLKYITQNTLGWKDSNLGDPPT
jgi:hypothetical protein